VRAATSLPYRELAGGSPVVVVGRVMTVKVVGPEVRTSDENQYPLRLRRVIVHVENILKGMANAGEIVFYRYDWSPNHAMVGPWGIVSPGERYVFFLEREGGTLRSTVDLYPSGIEVHSGRHSSYRPRKGQSTEESIAELLPTQGEDAHLVGFARSLLIASGFSMELVGKDDTLFLLKSLLAANEPLLRQQACAVMSERFGGIVDCSPNPSASPDRRRDGGH
jgi:hypothetical protein